MGVLHRYIGKDGNFEWEGVPAEKYEKGGAVGGTKCVLIGGRDSAVNFGLRYYEVAPGGQSSFDRHDHDHGVYILRGKARVLMGWEVVEVGAPPKGLKPETGGLDVHPPQRAAPV